MHARQALFAWVVLLATLSGACSEPVQAPLDDTTRYDSIVPWSGDPALKQWLAMIRDTTWAFHHEELARAAGYQPLLADCERSSEGSSGLPYGHPALLGFVPGSQPTTGTDTVTDPFHPEVLLYELQEVGPPRFVGIRFVVYRAAWESAHGDPPTLLGIRFDEKFGPEAGSYADYYELTVWLWRNNPLGMIGRWNPLVYC
jgi:hypothetical protein